MRCGVSGCGYNNNDLNQCELSEISIDKDGDCEAYYDRFVTIIPKEDHHEKTE